MASSRARSRRPQPSPVAGAAAELLGGLAARAFLRRHWQKAPLLVRGAIAGLAGLFTRDQLFALAGRDDVESRVVRRDAGRWSLLHGPFSQRTLRSLPPRNWSLLVQGVNLHVQEADALIRRFSFVPFARLDDLMVSYAAPGGGVGPHLDAYDVFLLQGFGRRRWRYGRPRDAAFRAGLPLKILRAFAPQCDEILHPGDLLYLPPEFAHDGVALDACTTYSVGFRAPAAAELADAFLQFLQDHLALEGRYSDPDLAPTDTPARIDATMQRRLARMLREVRWTPAIVARFVGTWLSEPKATVFFERPRKSSSAASFRQAARARGVRLDIRSQLLYDDEHLFINGLAVTRTPAQNVLVRLADARALPPAEVRHADLETLRILHEWHGNGYLHIGFD